MPFQNKMCCPVTTLQPTNGLTTPFASLTSAKWQQFGNTKLFIKVRAN